MQKKTTGRIIVASSVLSRDDAWKRNLQTAERDRFIKGRPGKQQLNLTDLGSSEHASLQESS